MALADLASPVSPVPARAVAAAQYIRMSTDLQQYSPEAQKQAIADYAKAHGIQVVRTYEDPGLSGLTLRERPALVRLLADVRRADRNFDTVLVLDVSRWGRFQDADESAYHEYECRRAGVRVVYCAEPFQNDGSPFACVYKSIKRAMAGEYSRELSVKVFLGQSRLVRLGFWQGASPGYGLRRQLLDAGGAVKGPLAPKEHKAIQTDRVVLVPGPANEVALIRKIFDWYVNEKISTTRIADRLNVMGLYNVYDRPWNKPGIREILRGEKYVGNNLYNRTSVRLHTRLVRNPPSEWIRSVGAFQRIIDPDVFDAAQVRLTRYSRGVVKEEIQRELEDLFQHTGHLSIREMARHLKVHGKSEFRRLFGSTASTYRCIGFTPTYSPAYIDTRRGARAVFRQLMASLAEQLVDKGHRISFEQRQTLLVIDGELKIKLTARLCPDHESRQQSWAIRWPDTYVADFLVVVLFGRVPVRVTGFYVFPYGTLPVGQMMTVCDQNIPALRAFYFANLDILHHLTDQTTLETHDGRRPTARE